MRVRLHIPIEELTGNRPNYELAADVIELMAFFDVNGTAQLTDLTNAQEINSEEEYESVEEELLTREELANGAAQIIAYRKRVLDEAYPYKMDSRCNIVTLADDDTLDYGKAAYIASLLLSHLTSVSDVLSASGVLPDQAEQRKLRDYFQYFATAGLAAEIQGRAWSFGSPRPDNSGFLEKLREIWSELCDGTIEVQPGAPDSPKDDQVDVLAARLPYDKQPGFILAAGQVATGKQWQRKGLRDHMNNGFPRRWFGRRPCTQFVCYHIIPFCRTSTELLDDTGCLGTILHRTRLPRRVHEAESLANSPTTPIEAYSQLQDAVEWIKAYRAASLAC